MISKIVDAWQGYTRRHPVVVTLALALLFTLAVLVMHAVNDTVYYKNNETMPGAVGGAIIALYLGGTFVIGLVTPMRVGAVGPVLALPPRLFYGPSRWEAATTASPTIPGGRGQCCIQWCRPPSSGWPPISAGYWAGNWKRDDRAMNNPTELIGP